MDRHGVNQSCTHNSVSNNSQERKLFETIFGKKVGHEQTNESNSNDTWKINQVKSRSDIRVLKFNPSVKISIFDKIAYM